MAVPSSGDILGLQGLSRSCPDIVYSTKVANGIYFANVSTKNTFHCRIRKIFNDLLTITYFSFAIDCGNRFISIFHHFAKFN